MPVSVIDKHVPTEQGRTVSIANERKISRWVRASPAGVGGSALSLLLTSFKKY